MRSMTGYGRGQSSHNGTKYSVELNSVNRKQSDVAVNLPHDLAELEPRVRDLINAQVSRGRLNVVIARHSGGGSQQKPAFDSTLARSYYNAMLELQKELKAAGEISIETILRAPGVLRTTEEQISVDDAWPHIESALKEALGDLIAMREREGKHLAKDLIKRLKLVRQALRKIRQLHPAVVRKYRQTLHERIQKAGLEIEQDDERLVKEVIFFADKSDISEELTRLESHFAQFAHTLRKHEPIGRTLDFMTQEIYRELNTLGAKANDVEISQLVVTCKAEMEKIREQIQNIE
ncbi:MAG TPA: YicC/YloC family endoribonuclease [Chthoniobacteraceae bacterium]|nr:YicC/YloC family endoribonuclease [Chthoniobacteraceae bacterium]